jgi:WD40 repeat protein
MSRKRSSTQIPEGLKLRHTLSGHKGAIHHLAWTFDGELLASASEDQTICIWARENGGIFVDLGRLPNQTLSIAWSPTEATLVRAPHKDLIKPIFPIEPYEFRPLGGLLDKMNRKLFSDSGSHAMAWSPDGRLLAAEYYFNSTITVWDVGNGRSMGSMLGHDGQITSLDWSNWDILASCSEDKTVKLWDMVEGETGERELIHSFEDHTDAVHQVVWSRDGKMLASASADRTVRIWNPQTLQPITVLKGHKSAVTSVSFSFDNRLLASKSHDGTVRLWRCDTWETVAALKEPSSGSIPQRIAFSPNGPHLATLDEEDTAVRIWEFDIVALCKTGTRPAPRPSKSKPLSRRKFDVFLAHNSLDKEAVLEINERLEERGLNPWVDKQDIELGTTFNNRIQEALLGVKSIAIFIGPKGLSKGQSLEVDASISLHLDTGLRLIPVLLPGVTKIPKELLFLRQFTPISFANGLDDEAALTELENTIRGK